MSSILFILLAGIRTYLNKDLFIQSSLMADDDVTA